MILVTNTAKPVQYTAKGSVRKAATVTAYTAEINALYDAVEETSQLDVKIPIVWDQPNTLEFVRTVITKVLKKSIDDEDDIYEQGCDRWAYVYIYLVWLGY